MRPRGRSLSRCSSSEHLVIKWASALPGASVEAQGAGPHPQSFRSAGFPPAPPVATPFYTHARVHDPWRTPPACPGLLQVILSQSTAPSPDFSVGLLLRVGVLACVCPEFSLTALSPASIRGIADHSLVGLFSTCFKRLFSMEIQRPGPRWPDSGLPIKISVALTSISSFLTGQRGPPSLNFYCSFASLIIE